MNPNVQPDKMNIAEEVLADAQHQVRTKNLIHGHTLRSFTMAAEMWSIYIKHAYTIRGDMNLRADDVAQMQSILKQVRSIYGESNDNYIDEAGYAALSAMLRPDAIKKWEQDRKKEAAKAEPPKEPIKFDEAQKHERLVPRRTSADHPLLPPLNLE